MGLNAQLDNTRLNWIHNRSVLGAGGASLPQITLTVGQLIWSMHHKKMEYSFSRGWHFLQQYEACGDFVNLKTHWISLSDLVSGTSRISFSDSVSRRCQYGRLCVRS
jgi:hypothetical protein